MPYMVLFLQKLDHNASCLSNSEKVFTMYIDMIKGNIKLNNVISK